MVKVPLPQNASTKRYHKTQALMGETRLASGIFSAALSRVKRCSYYLVEFVFLSTFYSPTRDASPPLVLAFLQALNATTKTPPLKLAFLQAQKKH